MCSKYSSLFHFILFFSHVFTRRAASMGTAWLSDVIGPDRSYRFAWSWRRIITATSSSAPAPWPTVTGRSPRSAWTSTCCTPRTDPPAITLALATGFLKATTNYQRVWPASNASSSGDILPGITGATVATAQVRRFSDIRTRMRRHYVKYISWTAVASKVAICY